MVVLGLYRCNIDFIDETVGMGDIDKILSEYPLSKKREKTSVK